MKSKKLKLLVVPIAVASASVIGMVSGTLAYFTSVDNASVSIEAGQVKVSYAVDSTTFATSTTFTNFAGTTAFENGGTVSLGQAANSVTVSKMTPGDVVEFDVKVNNLSNVDIKYKLTTSWEDKTLGTDPNGILTGKGLSNALVVSAVIKGTQTSILTTSYVDWDYSATAADMAKTMHVKVTFPVGDGDNAFQGAVSELSFGLDAIQQNAETAIVTNVSTTDQLQAALNAAIDSPEKQIIQLAPGNYDDVTINLNEGNGSTTITHDGAHNVALSWGAYQFDYRYRKVSNLTIKGGAGVNVSGISWGSGKCGIVHGYANFVQDPGNSEMYSYDSLFLENITFDGIKFTKNGIIDRHSNNVFDWAEHIGWADHDIEAGTSAPGNTKNLVIQNCTFESSTANNFDGGIRIVNNNCQQPGGLVYNSRNENISILNCTFKDIVVTDSSAIYLGLTKGDIVISGNTFDNVSYNAVQIPNGIEAGYGVNSCTITITNNNFVKLVNRVLRLNGAFDGVSSYNISGNKFYTSTSSKVEKYGEASVTVSGASYSIPFGANAWQDSLPDFTTEIKGFDINTAEQTTFTA